MRKMYEVTGMVLVVSALMLVFICIWYILFPDYIPPYTPEFLKFYAIALPILGVILIFIAVQDGNGGAWGGNL